MVLPAVFQVFGPRLFWQYFCPAVFGASRYYSIVYVSLPLFVDGKVHPAKLHLAWVDLIPYIIRIYIIGRCQHAKISDFSCQIASQVSLLSI